MQVMTTGRVECHEELIEVGVKQTSSEVSIDL